MKKRYLVSIIFFILPLAAVMLYSFFDEDVLFSEAENRELATMPALTPASYADGSFMSDFETYYNDQFPLRNAFLSLSKVYNSVMYPNFLISEDDIISLPPTVTVQTPSSGDASGAKTEDTEQADTESLAGSMIYKGRIMEIFNYSESVAKRYAAILNKLYAECGEPETYVLIPPPEYSLYAPETHITDSTSFDLAMDAVSEALDGPQLVDLRDTFEAVKDEYLYFRTDHHWTARGAYYACNAFLEAAEGTALKPLSEYKSGEREGFLGSLYKSAMTNQASSILEKNPDSVEYFYPFADAAVTAYSSAAMSDPLEREVLYPEYDADTNLYCIYMGGDIALGKIETQTKNGKSIMVVRDSYGHAFVPFLIDAYETIYLLEPRYFNESTNKIELGRFFDAQDIDTLLFVGYPNMSVGGYWDTISNYLEQITNLPE